MACCTTRLSHPSQGVRAWRTADAARVHPSHAGVDTRTAASTRTRRGGRSVGHTQPHDHPTAPVRDGSRGQERRADSGGRGRRRARSGWKHRQLSEERHEAGWKERQRLQQRRHCSDLPERKTAAVVVDALRGRDDASRTHSGSESRRAVRHSTGRSCSLVAGGGMSFVQATLRKIGEVAKKKKMLLNMFTSCLFIVHVDFFFL